MNINQTLAKAIEATADQLHLPKIDYSTEHPNDMLNGDYACNIAMVTFPKLDDHQKQTYPNPRALAQAIVDKLNQDSSIRDLVSGIEVAGPGFINFMLSQNFLTDQVKQITNDGSSYGQSDWGKGKSVVIDYSAPNIAKRFSIGHLRSTIIGQALYNIYSFLGWNTIGDNHLGDWGTQFGVLIYMVQQLQLNPYQLSVNDWEKLYVDFHEQLQNSPNLKENARDAFKKLEEGDEDAKNIWEAAHQTSMEEYARIYKLLGISIDFSYGESFYEDKMPAAIKQAQDKNIAYKSEGALVVDFSDYNLPSNILVKSNGTTTYLARDLALMFFRKQEWNPDLQIFEVGADQKLYFQQVFALAEMMGLFKLDQLKHIAHGMVRFKDGKMSTRKGKTIKLEEVINEAINKASNLTKQKSPLDKSSSNQLAHQIGVGALKWNDLKGSPQRDILFDWNEILNMTGNSGPYLQYAHARCLSVLNKSESIDIKLSSIDNYQFNPEELQLLRYFYRFPEIVKLAAIEYAPHHLCTYLYQLATYYNAFYNHHSILSANTPEQKAVRLSLTQATATILENGLSLLGIPTPEKM